MIPDDTAGPPLTPVEQAAIADLERRFLLTAAPPRRDHVTGARPARPVRRRPSTPTAGGILTALFVTAVVLTVVATLVGAGPLGAAAVIASSVATALVWPLVPARFGGPARARRRAFPARRPGPRRS